MSNIIAALKAALAWKPLIAAALPLLTYLGSVLLPQLQGYGLAGTVAAGALVIVFNAIHAMTTDSSN